MLSIDQLPRAGSTADDAVAVAPPVAAPRADAVAAAQKFEAFFIGEMFKQMRRGTRELASEDSIYRDKVNEDMLDLADGVVADSLAGQRAFGIADMILRQIAPVGVDSDKVA